MRIVGAGVLIITRWYRSFGNAPLAASFQPSRLFVIGTALSVDGFVSIGRVCSLTGTTSFRDAWSASISKENELIRLVCDAQDTSQPYSRTV
jgi:hypothetical protein